MVHQTTFFPLQSLIILCEIAPPFTFERETRTDIIKAVLQDLKNCGSKSRLTGKGSYKGPNIPFGANTTHLVDAALALLAVKTLGKDPSGSAFIASSENLSTLLGLAATFKDDQDASCEALRCIANALLLIEGARSTFISKEVNGGDICITILEVIFIMPMWPCTYRPTRIVIEIDKP